MDHLDLPPDCRNDISYATCESGHMVYLETRSHAKMKRDFAAFLDSARHGD